MHPSFGPTPEELLHQAIAADDLSRARSIAEQNPETLPSNRYGFAPSAQALTLPMIAAKNGAARCLRWLLSLGLPTDSETLAAQSALGFACEHGHLGCARMLIEAHAPLEYLSSSGHQPLMMAAANGYADCVLAMLDAGAKPDALDRLGMTALMHAALAGSEDCCEALLRRGADPARRDFHGRSAPELADARGKRALGARLRSHAISRAEKRSLSDMLSLSGLPPDGGLFRL